LIGVRDENPGARALDPGRHSCKQGLPPIGKSAINLVSFLNFAVSDEKNAPFIGIIKGGTTARRLRTCGKNDRYLSVNGFTQASSTFSLSRTENQSSDQISISPFVL